MVLDSLSPSNSKTAIGSWRESWQRNSLLCLFQPAVSPLLPCPSLPASPQSCSRYQSCVPPLFSHFSLHSLLWLWALHPCHSSRLLSLLARSCPMFHFPLWALPHQLTLPRQFQFSPASLLLFSTSSKLLFPLSSFLLQVVTNVSFHPPSLPVLSQGSHSLPGPRPPCI